MDKGKNTTSENQIKALKLKILKLNKIIVATIDETLILL